MEPFFYEDEAFIYNQVPIRVFNHSFYKEIYSTPLHWHKNLEIDLISKGEFVFRIDSKEQYCVPEDILLINSSVPHSYYLVTQDERFEGITVQLSIRFVQDWLGENTWFELPGEAEEKKQLAMIIRRMGEIEKLQQSDHDLRMMAEAFTLLSFLKLHCQRKMPQEKKQEEMMERIKKVIRYIENNHQKNITLEKTAEDFGYSKEHFSRMFKRYVGTNFYKYLQEVRLNHAVALLKEKETISLMDCALESGFPNNKSFLSAFKERFGMSPSKWRRDKSIINL